MGKLDKYLSYTDLKWLKDMGIKYGFAWNSFYSSLNLYSMDTIVQYCECVDDFERKMLLSNATFRYIGQKAYRNDTFTPALTSKNEAYDRIKSIIESIIDEHKDAQIERRTFIGFDSQYNKVLNGLKTMPYSDYLNTGHWKHFREEAIKAAHNKCQLCNSEDKTFNIHHRTYDNRGRETFSDVIVLCKDCHAKFHGKSEAVK